MAAGGSSHPPKRASASWGCRDTCHRPSGSELCSGHCGSSRPEIGLQAAPCLLQGRARPSPTSPVSREPQAFPPLCRHVAAFPCVSLPFLFS